MPNASTSFFGWVAFLLQKYGMLFLRGTGMTLLIALTGTALGFALGLLVAIIRTIALPEKKKTGSNVGVTLRRGLLRLAQLLMNVYIQVFRGTPMIVQAVAIYYGAQYAGVFRDTTFAAIFIISINTGAYMAEIIRGGIESIDKGQTEAGRSIGFNDLQTMRYIILPQTIKLIMPSLANQALNPVKNTSVLAMVAGLDLMYFADSWGSDRGYFAQAYFSCALLYFVICFPLARLARYLEARAKRLPVPKKRKEVA